MRALYGSPTRAVWNFTRAPPTFRPLPCPTRRYATWTRVTRQGFMTRSGAALRWRDALGRLGLKAYAKTRGGQGLYAHVPLAPGYSFEEVRECVKSVCRADGRFCCLQQTL